MNISEQVIPLWTICYDGDVNRIYNFTNFEKAIASIDGSIRSYFDNGEEFDKQSECDETCRYIIDKIREYKNYPCVPMRFNNLHIILYSWEIGSTDPLHRILTECHAMVDESMKTRIEGLFVESVR